MNNNDDNKKIRQINRIATPIKLDQNGQRIESDDNPVILTVEEKNELREERRIEEKNRKIEEHDPSTAIFVVVLLIIFAILVAFIYFYVVPKYIESRGYNLEYNDKPKTTTTAKKTYPLTQYTLIDTVYINNANVFNINNFEIEYEYNGTNFNLIVNGTMVDKSDYLLPKVAIVDDLLLIATQDRGLRTTTLYAVDEVGVVIKEWYNLADMDGMVLLPDSSSIIFNNVNFVLLGSRVVGKELILENTFGKVTGVNLCNESLVEHNVDEKFLVLGTFTIEYLGNHEFSEPRLIHSTSIVDYKTINNLCN